MDDFSMWARYLTAGLSGLALVGVVFFMKSASRVLEQYVHDLALQMNGQVLDPESRGAKNKKAWIVECFSGGQRVLLSFLAEVGGSRYSYGGVCVLVLAAAVKSNLSLFLSRETKGDALAKGLGLLTEVTLGDEAFDSRYLIRAEEQQVFRLQDILLRTDMREAVDSIMSVCRLWTVHDGRIELYWHPFDLHTDPAVIREMIAKIIVVKRILDDN